MNKNASTFSIRGRKSRAIVALSTAAAVSASAVFVAPIASAQEGGSSEGSSVVNEQEQPGGSSVAGDQDQTGGSSVAGLDRNQQCLAAGLGVGLPLILLLPLGLSSQLAVPGLTGVIAQVEEAAQQANTAIQQQLGIFDEQIAATAASFGIDLAPIVGAGSSISNSVASLAAVAAGLTIITLACAPNLSYEPSSVSFRAFGETTGGQLGEGSSIQQDQINLSSSEVSQSAAPTTTEQPAPTTTEQPAPTTTEQPEPTTTEQPAPTTTEQPAQ